MTRHAKAGGTYMHWNVFSGLLWAYTGNFPSLWTTSVILRSALANMIAQTQKNVITQSGKHQRGMSALDMTRYSTEIFKLALRVLVWAHGVLCCYMEITGAWKKVLVVLGWQGTYSSKLCLSEGLVHVGLSPKWHSHSASSYRTCSNIRIVSEFSAESFTVCCNPKVSW